MAKKMNDGQIARGVKLLASMIRDAEEEIESLSSKLKEVKAKRQSMYADMVRLARGEDVEAGSPAGGDDDGQ